MKSGGLIIQKLSGWRLVLGLNALAITMLVIVQPLSHSAAAKKEPSAAAVGTPPLQKSKGSRQKVQASAANVLVNNPVTDQNPGKTQNNATITLGLGSSLVSAYNDSGSLLSGNKFSGYSRSTDMGATWTDIGAFPFTESGFPSVASDNATGRIYFSALRFGAPGFVVSSSTDGGATWNGPTVFVQPSGTTDRQLIAVDNFAGSGNGNLYLSYNLSGDGIRLARSTDFGSTFSAPTLVASQGLFNV